MEYIETRISVRELVEFLEKSGDLDGRYTGRRETKAMQAGSRLHRKIQGRMGSGYHAEVPLKLLQDLGDVVLILEGRADGIWTDEDVTVVDEIKGTYRNIWQMECPERVHLAQAKCYAYVYALQNHLPRIRTRMVYADLETEELRFFTEEYEWEVLKDWFSDLVERYHKWLSFQSEWKEHRETSLKMLQFPYPYREGQKDLAASVYRSILRKKRLFIQAPTGVGKTLSTLFPALKAVGEGLGDKIFYLTARTITRTVAADTLDLLRKQGMRVKSVVLTAKEKLCVCEEVQCDPEHCPRAKGHMNRINDAVFELWTKGPDACTREVILAHAEKWQVCPFEMSLDLAIWMDVIICDYNYVFDPRVCLKRFFADGVKGDYLFLVDEAHNLVERGREMYSASLCKEDFLDVKKLVRGKSQALTKALDRCNRYLLTLKRECEEGWKCLEGVDGFTIPLMQLTEELNHILEQSIEENLRKTLTDFWFQMQRFLDTCDRLDENYEIYMEIQEDGRFVLHLYCVRPSENLRNCLDRGNSTVFFSATLLPVNYYKALLTGDQEDYAVYAQSPFEQAQRLLLIGMDVSSRYTRRGEQEYVRMADYICQTAENHKGNYLVFFPSYRLMEAVYEKCKQRGNFRCERQSGDMKEEEREAFLRLFEEEREESLAAFCVMGGIFSEGIDLTGERLVGAMIIGTGLPQVCREREILKQYFDRRGMDGFAYAYQYPGMNKVLQAAGRVIRTTEDRGVILLLDERFGNTSYQNLFPREWSEHARCRLQELSGYLTEFWNGLNQD